MGCLDGESTEGTASGLDAAHLAKGRMYGLRGGYAGDHPIVDQLGFKLMGKLRKNVPSPSYASWH